jgi:hypothetical protein
MTGGHVKEEKMLRNDDRRTGWNGGNCVYVCRRRSDKLTSIK